MAGRAALGPRLPLPACRSRLLQTHAASARWHLDAAVALDIDGVLVRGAQTLDEGRRALRMLSDGSSALGRIPFVLLTNGGGVSEAAKAADLSRRLGVPISPRQVVLAHSPMQALAARYAARHVLVVGGAGRRCAEIARAYGFGNVSTPDDVVAWRPAAWPFMAPPPAPPARPRDYAADPFHAVLVFHDSFDFGRDLQIVTDVLRARGGVAGGAPASRQSVPLYMSNADLIFANDFAQPRLGQGAFHVCLRAMWAALTAGAPLEYTCFGKPFRVQYDFAERLLDRLALDAAPAAAPARLRARRIYAIGDNPAADIAGANGAGWTSLLVRTGVFSGANDPTHPAAAVFDHVADAVEWIIASERARQEAA
ncbi:hypothetical protein H4R18_002459 [Coemansia javaensis]|uniref:Uncharacterized protein n=1 Tax=Coemansia javaensis TaxID=2761396 RepID=A0A9W8LJV7_9FUNG|nr:hypothetical protein H4R18_002459 [Coemansia javaensis]